MAPILVVLSRRALFLGIFFVTAAIIFSILILSLQLLTKSINFTSYITSSGKFLLALCFSCTFYCFLVKNFSRIEARIPIIAAINFSILAAAVFLLLMGDPLGLWAQDAYSVPRLQLFFAEPSVMALAQMPVIALFVGDALRHGLSLKRAIVFLCGALSFLATLSLGPQPFTSIRINY